jgi:hypothetical protein
VTDYPGEQFPPAVDPDVEPGHEPRPDENGEPDYDIEPGPDAHTPWVNPTLQGRPHTDPLLAGFTVYGDPTPEPEEAPADEFLTADDTEQAFEASLEEPTQHSFVDDGPDDSYDDQPAVPEPTPAPAPVVPTPAVAFPRPAVPSPGQGFSRPAAPAHVVQASAAPAVVPAEERGEEGVHPLVEETMERLDGLRDKAVGEHAEVYADLHERLQSALVEADAEHGDRG